MDFQPNRVRQVIDIPHITYSPSSIVPVVFLLILAWNVACYTANALKPGLRSIPGPFLARFSGSYRFWKICKGNAPQFYQNLHDQYGPIVRTAPNHVSISDPNAISAIYGISSKYLKASPFKKESLDVHSYIGVSLHSTTPLAPSIMIQSCQACSQLAMPIITDN